MLPTDGYHTTLYLVTSLLPFVVNKAYQKSDIPAMRRFVRILRLFVYVLITNTPYGHQ